MKNISSVGVSSYNLNFNISIIGLSLHFSLYCNAVLSAHMYSLFSRLCVGE